MSEFSPDKIIQDRRQRDETIRPNHASASNNWLKDGNKLIAASQQYSVYFSNCWPSSIWVFYMKEGWFDRIIDEGFPDRDMRSDVIIIPQIMSGWQRIKLVFLDMIDMFFLLHSIIHYNIPRLRLQFTVYYLLEV